jgi:hypothetical protein
MRETPDDREGWPALVSPPVTSTERSGSVAIVVVLLPASENEPSLQPAAVSELGRLGVTSVSLARDDRTLALVVEGWAFDPGRSAEAVVAAVAGPRSGARTLHPLLHMAVATAAPTMNGKESK